MAIPRAYFDAVKRREPRQLEKATEKVLFEQYVLLSFVHIQSYIQTVPWKYLKY